VLLLLLSLYCIDLFSCKAASVFAINLLTYLLTYLKPENNVAFTGSAAGCRVVGKQLYIVLCVKNCRFL